MIKRITLDGGKDVPVDGDIGHIHDLDELFATDLKTFHLERMSDGYWWMRLEFEKGRNLVVNLATRRGAKILGSVESE